MGKVYEVRKPTDRLKLTGEDKLLSVLKVEGSLGKEGWRSQQEGRQQRKKKVKG